MRDYEATILHPAVFSFSSSPIPRHRLLPDLNCYTPYLFGEFGTPTMSLRIEDVDLLLIREGPEKVKSLVKRFQTEDCIFKNHHHLQRLR